MGINFSVKSADVAVRAARKDECTFCIEIHLFIAAGDFVPPTPVSEPTSNHMVLITRDAKTSLQRRETSLIAITGN